MSVDLVINFVSRQSRQLKWCNKLWKVFKNLLESSIMNFVLKLKNKNKIFNIILNIKGTIPSFKKKLEKWCKIDFPKKFKKKHVAFHNTNFHTMLLACEFTPPLQLNVQTGLARKKKAGTWSPLAFFHPRQVVSYRWSKK